MDSFISDLIVCVFTIKHTEAIVMFGRKQAFLIQLPWLTHRSGLNLIGLNVVLSFSYDLNILHNYLRQFLSFWLLEAQGRSSGQMLQLSTIPH